MIPALVGMGDGGWGSGSKRSLGSGTLLGALILLSVKWRHFKGWSSFPQAPVECFRKLFLDRYLGIVVTRACGDEEEVGSGDELSFKVGQGDPRRGRRNPVTFLSGLWDRISGPPTVPTSGLRDPGKGHFRSRDCGSDFFHTGSSKLPESSANSFTCIRSVNPQSP